MDATYWNGCTNYGELFVFCGLVLVFILFHGTQSKEETTRPKRVSPLTGGDERDIRILVYCIERAIS